VTSAAATARSAIDARRRLWVTLAAAIALAACTQPAPDAPPIAARHLLLVTIDTLRADRVGAYGHAAARTPTLDGLARDGTRFDRAYSVAPITLTAHASLLTGRYPPAHQARHNGMAVDAALPTLAHTLKGAGFATGAFVAAFPLDRRFGLAGGFDTYGDRWPRAADGRPVDERPGRAVVDEATAWIAGNRTRRMFLWVHLFEPHAPYGAAGDGRPVAARYDDEVAEADAQVRRLLEALGPERAATLVVAAADHGEAFGEHGEIGHSLFVYDTTLRVPLLMAGPGVPAGRVFAGPVSLVDVMPTALARLAVPAPPGDGVDLTSVLAGKGDTGARALYAESFAPLLDFGWSPLRALRVEGRKYIAAPRPELYDLGADPDETQDLATRVPDLARRLAAQVEGISPARLERPAAAIDGEAARRLQSLGYVASRPAGAAASLADPKDRRQLAARIATVTSGEAVGPALEQALRAILAEDPANPQANLRLGTVLAASNRCGEAEAHLSAAIRAGMPTADAHLGLAGCLAAARRFADADRVLAEGLQTEPDNAVVIANQGLLRSSQGRPLEAVSYLERAVALDPDFDQARFNLAVALASGGRREAALTQAETLLGRLPPAAPQRAEVQRLIGALK
jgi:choline-sulfatase